VGTGPAGGVDDVYSNLSFWCDPAAALGCDFGFSCHVRPVELIGWYVFVCDGGRERFGGRECCRCSSKCVAKPPSCVESWRRCRIFILSLGAGGPLDQL